MVDITAKPAIMWQAAYIDSFLHAEIGVYHVLQVFQKTLAHILHPRFALCLCFPATTAIPPPKATLDHILPVIAHVF